VEDKQELLLLESSTSQSNRSRMREGLSFTSFYAGQTRHKIHVHSNTLSEEREEEWSDSTRYGMGEDAG